jgi:hypothetical protein
MLRSFFGFISYLTQNTLRGLVYVPNCLLWPCPTHRSVSVPHTSRSLSHTPLGLCPTHRSVSVPHTARSLSHTQLTPTHSVCCADCNSIWICSTDCTNKRYITFHERSSSVGRVIPCERTDGRTDTHDKASSRFTKSKKRLPKTKLLRIGDGGGGGDVVIHVTMYHLFLKRRTVVWATSESAKWYWSLLIRCRTVTTNCSKQEQSACMRLIAALHDNSAPTQSPKMASVSSDMDITSGRLFGSTAQPETLFLRMSAYRFRQLRVNAEKSSETSVTTGSNTESQTLWDTVQSEPTAGWNWQKFVERGMF